MAEECQMEVWKGCCCTCEWQFIDRSHPASDGKAMSNTRGYICAEPFLGFSSEWTEHGMCECWEKRPERPEGDNYDAQAWDARYTKRDAMPTFWALQRK